MNAQDKGKFGVLLGIDGSGKSTILHSLKTRGIYVARWQDLRRFEEVAHIAPLHPGEQRVKLKSMSRAMFVASYLVAEYEYLIEPVISEGRNVILDSYYFKWYAKETIFQKTSPLFFEICKQLPNPDFIIMLRISPTMAYSRKRGELSVSEYATSPTLVDFVEFQNKVINILDRITERIPKIEVDAEKGISLVEKDIISAINQFLR